MVEICSKCKIPRIKAKAPEGFELFKCPKCHGFTLLRKKK